MLGRHGDTSPDSLEDESKYGKAVVIEENKKKVTLDTQTPTENQITQHLAKILEKLKKL